MVVFLVDIDSKWKTGLFNAVESRIRFYTPELVLNISIIDSGCLKILKILFRKKVNLPKQDFSIGKTNVEVIVIKRGLIQLIMSKFSFSLECLLKVEASKIWERIRKINPHNENIDLIAHWGLTAGLYSYFLRGFVTRNFNFYHGSDVHTEPFKNKNILKLTVSAMQTATRSFFVSRGLLADAIKLGYTGNNNAISYNGVNVSDFKRPRYQGLYPVVGFAGNLWEVKGADLLPSIFSEIKKSIPNVIFRVAGDGHLFGRISKEFLELELNVEMLGKLQPNEMPSFFSSVDLVVIPSRNEALSIVAIEALCCGCNVVASNIGGIPEVIEPSYLVDWSPSFIENFAEKICHVLNDKPVQTLNPCFEQFTSLDAEYKKIMMHEGL